MEEKQHHCRKRTYHEPSSQATGRQHHSGTVGAAKTIGLLLFQYAPSTSGTAGSKITTGPSLHANSGTSATSAAIPGASALIKVTSLSSNSDNATTVKTTVHELSVAPAATIVRTTSCGDEHQFRSPTSTFGNFYSTSPLLVPWDRGKFG
ncbi:hypothetical protein A2U01_0030744, partial [Trifolium medium]|nr:hypothetical protein [Trifolium medium]